MPFILDPDNDSKLTKTETYRCQLCKKELISVPSDNNDYKCTFPWLVENKKVPDLVDSCIKNWHRAEKICEPCNKGWCKNSVEQTISYE